MARERFGNYDGDDLVFDLQNANFPGVELDFCSGDGALFTPYEFNWLLQEEMMATPTQIGALAHQIIDSINISNSYFHLKANGITFIVILHDPAHTGSLLVSKYPFKSVEEMMEFRNESSEVLRNVVRSYQRKIKKPLIY